MGKSEARCCLVEMGRCGAFEEFENEKWKIEIGTSAF
jgi:hypothetical protein